MSSGILLCTFSFSSEVMAVVMDNADCRLFAATSTGRIYQINCFDEVHLLVSFDCFITGPESDTLIIHMDNWYLVQLFYDTKSKIIQSSGIRFFKEISNLFSDYHQSIYHVLVC